MHAPQFQRGGKPEYVLQSQGYYTGTVRFGPKSYTVAVVDANANGLYGDPFRGFSPDQEKLGDLFLVDVNNDGRFDQGSFPPREMLFCGHCVVVDGRFYVTLGVHSRDSRRVYHLQEQHYAIDVVRGEDG